MDAQVGATEFLSQLAVLLPVGYAFGAGMVSAVNPCGFAMYQYTLHCIWVQKTVSSAKSHRF
jgi:cytochrome c biogenesis protein CcdA